VATIASLLVNLSMNTAGFSKGSRKGVRDLDTLAKSAMALNSALNIVSAGAGAINSVFDSFGQSSQMIDDIGKLSDRSGFSTESLVALQHGAQLAGVDVEQLNGALTKMSVTLGKSLEGGGATETLDKLGLSAQHLVAIAPDKALGEIADSINRLPTPAEKAAAAVALFGKSGAELLNFLSGGSKGLAEMREAADRLGITFSRIDAQRVEEANDAIDRMRMAFGGLKQELVIGTAPALNITATAFTNMLASLRNGDILGGLDLLNNLADAQEKIAREAEDSFYNGQAASEAAKANQAYADSFDEISKSAGKVGPTLSSFEQMIKQLREDQLLVGLSGIDREIGKANISGQLNSQQRFELGSEATKLKDLEEEAKVREHANELIKQAIAPEKQFADLEKQITGLAEAGKISWEQYMALYEEGAAKLAERMPKPEEPKVQDTGPERPTALLRGSAEAFSASFGAKPISDKLAESIALQRQMLKVLEKQNQPQVAQF